MQALFQDFSEQVRTLLLPKKYFAPQTLLWLSLFSLVIAAALDSIDGEAAIDEPDSIAIRIISNLSWIFLVSSIWWALHENPIKVGNFSISPWITGAVLCFFLFEPWEGENQLRWAISSWPMISTGVMTLPDVVNWELKFSWPKRKQQKSLIFTVLINLLLTSWIVFHFRIQDWVTNYPSLLVSSLENSAFVSDFTDKDRQEPSQGVMLLESTADAITKELNGQPWYQTERWLYTRKNRLEAISQRMLAGLASPKERIFWRMAVPEPRRLGDGYRLTLRATWLGPVGQDEGFFLEKACKIVPVDRVRPVETQQSQVTQETPPDEVSPTSRVTQVECDEDLPKVQWIKSDAA
ncbi:MAG: DUF5357 family protein [Phormidesmis sp.]